MYILKKNGEQQLFDPEKVATSIARASDDVSQPLGAGELRELKMLVTQRVQAFQTNPLPSSCVQVAVIASLKEMGFHTIAQSYYEAGL